ncbi:Transcription factor, K-box [Dillenia turbinata]|uniref:Transcription factor, K-box n=1 Tax=Dillenia turbinata TaxID=194707 RepID=A0AAN8YZM1_9MAGN
MKLMNHNLEKRMMNTIMERILERYERHSYSEGQLIALQLESNASWTFEHAKLKARMEVLQKNQRHYMGEDLESLSFKELQNLELQLDTALKHIRTKRNQVMFESISELQKNDKALQEQNNVLAKKIKQREKALAQESQRTTQNPEVGSPSFLMSHPLHSLSLGASSETYQRRSNGGEEEGTQSLNRTNSLMPPWMLCHAND